MACTAAQTRHVTRHHDVYFTHAPARSSTPGAPTKGQLELHAASRLDLIDWFYVQADSIPTAATVYTAAVSSFRPLAVNCDAPRDCAERRVSNVLKCLGLLFRTVSNQGLQHHVSESTPASFGLSRSGDTRPRLRSLGVLSPISNVGSPRASTRDCDGARYIEAADDPSRASERGPGDTFADHEVVRSAKDDGSVTSGGGGLSS